MIDLWFTDTLYAKMIELPLKTQLSIDVYFECGLL